MVTEPILQGDSWGSCQCVDTSSEFIIRWILPLYIKARNQGWRWGKEQWSWFLGQGGRNRDLRVVRQDSRGQFEWSPSSPTKSRTLHAPSYPVQWELRQAAGWVAQGGCREWSHHVAGKSDQLRGPGNGNQSTVYSETGIFLIHQGRLFSYFLEQIALFWAWSLGSAWAATRSTSFLSLPLWQVVSADTGSHTP